MESIFIVFIEYPKLDTKDVASVFKYESTTNEYIKECKEKYPDCNFYWERWAVNNEIPQWEED